MLFRVIAPFAPVTIKLLCPPNKMGALMVSEVVAVIAFLKIALPVPLTSKYDKGLVSPITPYSIAFVP